MAEKGHGLGFPAWMPHRTAWVPHCPQANQQLCGHAWRPASSHTLGEIPVTLWELWYLCLETKPFRQERVWINDGDSPRWLKEDRDPGIDNSLSFPVAFWWLLELSLLFHRCELGMGVTLLELPLMRDASLLRVGYAIELNFFSFLSYRVMVGYQMIPQGSRNVNLPESSPRSLILWGLHWLNRAFLALLRYYKPRIFCRKKRWKYWAMVVTIFTINLHN